MGKGLVLWLGFSCGTRFCGCAGGHPCAPCPYRNGQDRRQSAKGAASLQRVGTDNKFCFPGRLYLASVGSVRLGGTAGRQRDLASIVEALPAAAGNAGMDRDSGFVVFQLFEKSDDGKKMQPVSKHTLTQDDFIRYLITGVMPQELDEDLTKR